jgi:hypothetical protein
MDPLQWLKDDLNKLESNINARFLSIETKVDEILQFKYKVIGGTILASLLLTAAFQLVLAFIQRN